MSQKSITTTTSFIVSSDESLNKPQLSSSQSTDSCEYMTANESIQNNQYFVSLNSSSNTNNMVLNQQNRFHSSSVLQTPTPSVQSFHQIKQVANKQRSSLNNLVNSSTNPLMPINFKGMLLNGVADEEVLRDWLKSINCEEYLNNFVDNGYDMPLLTRMTPQDLTAIGCISPTLRKKLLIEIKKLNLEDDIPECRPHSLEQWLELMKLAEYYSRFCQEGYDSIDKVCELTWEDLEDFGVTKLGHQKRLLIGIERVKKFDKQQEERQSNYAIYDVHPNHRMSLYQNNSDNRLSTLGRSTLRSGFFQTRSGATLDHRGLPIATVVPAIKHVNNTLANLDISSQMSTSSDGSKSVNQTTNGHGNTGHSINDINVQMQPVYLDKNLDNTSTNTATLKQVPPPLPPIRTNSLKFPQDTSEQLNNNNIYGNNYGVITSNGINSCNPNSTNSTSFLRTPKLGTLTATTNRLLTSGGHIQSLSVQPAAIRSILPIREAPPPPNQALPQTIPEENFLPIRNFNPSMNSVTVCTILNSSSISHQLASADEFPPPPPAQ